MLQDSFDRRVRALSTSPTSVAQYFINLFRREKSERVAIRCLFPTVRHDATALLDSNFPRSVMLCGARRLVSTRRPPVRKSSRFERRESCMQAARRSEIHLSWSEDRPKTNTDGGNVPVNRKNSVVQRGSCSLREADGWQELRPTGRRSPAIILLGSSCRVICSCPRPNLIPQNPDSTDHRAVAETHIQMGRTDQFRHRHRGQDRSSSPIEASLPPSQ
jgi:hypothetical protein